MSSLIEQLNLKLKLETQFHPEIKRVFVSMVQDFKATVMATGLPLNANTYNSVWKAVLNNHYRRVQKAFLGAVTNKKANDEDTNEEVLLLALLTWRQSNTGTQAQRITDTNAKNMREALQIARSDLQAEGNFNPSNKELALASTAILKRKYAGRITGISMTETQSSAESTKLIEAQVESGLTPTVLGGSSIAGTVATKKWMDVGDNKVRDFHRRSRIKEVRVNQPFMVASELLMFPGDSSLGASVWNTAN